MDHLKTADQRITELFDIAGKILETAYAEQEVSRGASDQLDESRRRIESQLGALVRNIKTEIEQSAEKTATLAAQKLQDNFVQADQAARDAKDRYEASARSLGWKMFTMFLVAAVVIFGGAWFAFQRTVPSVDDIRSGYIELFRLESSISDMTKMNTKLKMQLCPDQSGYKNIPCVKTDEHDDYLWNGVHGDETYRRLWKP